jgi:hypothetical protein
MAVAQLQGPYWVDERIVLRLIERWGPAGILLELPVSQPHYPTWYLLPELAGPAAAEAVSAACMPLTVWWTIGAAEELYDERSALLAGSLVALSPFLAEQAGWLRMYAPLSALAALTLRLALAGDGRSALPSLAAAALHPFGSLLVAWNAAVSRDRASGAGLAAAGLAAAAYAVLKLTKTGDTPGRPPMVDKTGVGHGVVPPLYELLSAPAAALGGSPRFRAGVAGAVLVGAVAAHTDRRVAAWAWGPPLAIAAASALVHPVWELKYMGMVAPAVAVGVADPRSGRWRQAAVAVLVVWYALNYWLSTLGAPLAHRAYFWFV